MIQFKGLKICVLQPDYSTTNVAYKYYDPVRNLNHLIPEAHFTYILLNKLTTYSQLKTLKYQGFDIFVNLCEGYLEWKIPSIDVIYCLDLLDLPYTGSPINLYDPSKKLMKYVAFCQGVKTPHYHYIDKIEQLDRLENLKYPLFIKPAKAGDSLGIDTNSLVHNFKDLTKKVKSVLLEFKDVLIEEFIDGDEYTVLVYHDAVIQEYVALNPIQYIFPSHYKYKTYQQKTSELHPEANIPCAPGELNDALRRQSVNIFKGFNGKGYARLDFRVNKNNEIFFLEINFACSVFYTNGLEGSADYILKYDPLESSGFLKKIIEDGIQRFEVRKKLYEIKPTKNAGYGIFALKDIAKGTLVFKGEEKPQRIVTLEYIQNNWSLESFEDFKRYAFPISDTHYILWDLDPNEWAPQNHCCDANTIYHGLNVYTTKDVKTGEELTLDYAKFSNRLMEPFQCACNSIHCRGYIQIN